MIYIKYTLDELVGRPRQFVPKVIIESNSQFRDLVGSYPYPMVAYFYAEYFLIYIYIYMYIYIFQLTLKTILSWCEQCQELGPKLQNKLSEYQKVVTYVLINTDNNKHITDFLEVNIYLDI